MDSLTARLRLGQLLSGTKLRPSGLAPAAILCIRRLHDPRPETLELGPQDVRAPREWEHALVSALDRMMREAARPADEAVPASADAVLFADRAEMLACLARDICHGTSWTRWWWRGILPRVHGDAEGAGLLWLEQPQYAPAAMALLAAGGDAVPFARMIRPAVALELTARVAAAFAAPALQAEALAAHATGHQKGPRQSRAGQARASPWGRIVPEASLHPLLPEQELMLGALLTLRRAPALARSRAFAEQVRVWRLSESSGSPAASPPLAPPPLHVRDGARNDTRLDAHGEPTGTGIDRKPANSDHVGTLAARSEPTPRSPEPGPGAAASPPAATAAASAATDSLDRHEPVLSRPIRILPQPPQTRDLASPAAADPPAPTTAQEPNVPAHPPADATEQDVLEQAEAGASPPVPPDQRRREREPDHRAAQLDPTALTICTQLGGLFYLLNLALHLGLYADFTAPLEPGISLDAWEFVELLGGRLLGRRPPDPVWGLLARLAGRGPGERAGRRFTPPRAWRVSPTWLEPFDRSGVWRWSAADGVLRIVHPRGFPVVAVPRSSSSPSAQLPRELKRLGPSAPERPPVRTALAREPARPLGRWVARLGAYVDARLQAALRPEPGCSPAEILIEHRARVHVSPSHVDVILDLAWLPLEIRIAGLDRDPGWIPAAGRYLTFHFE
jgi:hypothetical protein